MSQARVASVKGVRWRRHTKCCQNFSWSKSHMNRITFIHNQPLGEVCNLTPYMWQNQNRCSYRIADDHFLLVKVTKYIKISQSKQELCKDGVTSHTNSPRQVVRFREQGAQWGSQIAGHRYCSRHTQIAGDESPNVEVWKESQQCVESKQWDRTEQRSCQPLFEWHTLWWLPP